MTQLPSQTNENPTSPFRIRSEGQGLRHSAIKLSAPLIERLLRFPELNELHNITASLPKSQHVATRMLQALKVHTVVKPEYLAQIPTSGPVLVVANHPFGGIEGIVLAHLLQQVRPDFKLLTNEMLGMIPELRDDFLTVNVFGGKETITQNSHGLRQAIRWVKNGHCLGVFPAGEVSHLKVKRRRVIDSEWNPQIARIAQRTGATVVPIFFEGRNSAAFQLAGLVHPRLRTVMLPNELIRRRGRRIRARIGRPISPQRISQFENPEALSDYLRVRTYLLKRQRQQTSSAHLDTQNSEPIAAPITPARLHDAFATLPKERLLLSSGDLDVYCLHTSDSADIMAEIGTLREICFRAVGEGTGQARDLDRFDQHYRQLIVWNRENHQIVGGYRLGLSDNILATQGIKGLYIHTLFDVSKKLLHQMGPSIELGRSWVHPEYQKNFAPLMLLWKGIGHFCVQNPQYRHLIGPVSISADYDPISVHMLTTFLKLNAYLPDLAKLVKPRTPLKDLRPQPYTLKQFSTVVENLDEVNQLVSDLEADGKPIPILLRQYLKLNGQILGFNVDPDFGNVVDALITIDLTSSDRRLLDKYLGKEGKNTFLAFHGVTP